MQHYFVQSGPPQESPTVEDYLKAVYEIGQCSVERSATTGSVANRLCLSAGTVTSMFKRLADEGLVTHRPYHGVCLTVAGERVAKEVLYRHEVIETFLCRVLGVSEVDMHSEAERLEHSVSNELVARMDKFLQSLKDAA